MTDQKPVPPVSAALVRAGLIGSALLLIGSAVAFYYASRMAGETHQLAAGNVYKVTIEARKCTPDSLTIPAGKATFEILNRSQRAVEWEILDGVMVVAERENILPGFNQTLSAKLTPGEYEITCGLLSNPRGKLIVTPTAESEAEKGKLPLQVFLGPLAEYQIYLMGGVADFHKRAAELSQAIHDGDLAMAQALYSRARVSYARVAPVSEAFSDLDTAINARADYFEQREEDPAFGGLHRIEYGLFAKQSLDGLAPVADKLVADSESLKNRLRSLRLSPDRLLGGAQSALERFASTAGDRGEDRYAHTDMWAFAGLYEGVSRITDLLRPVIENALPNAFDATGQDLARLKSAITSTAVGDGYKALDALSPDEKAKLEDGAVAVAAQIAKLREQLGVE
ncbi:iron uptake system protein EfeO [Daeguia caeni]|uniref:Iron uptake system protein EfeO n=1 Tax=Daeguia caeni TaxID=439612 RepID=A0ABV9H608_9HYPH